MRKKTYKGQGLAKQLALIFGRVSLLAVLAISGVLVLDHSRHAADVAKVFSLNQIHYRGLAQLDREELDELIFQNVSEDLLLIDLDRVRALVESESWVKESTIRRKLPDGLLIHITEREAAAVAVIDAELYIVDQAGVILDNINAENTSLEYPIVKGLKNVARENAREENAVRMGTYMRVLAELALHNASISEIDVGIPASVSVIPEGDPVPIYLGDKDFLKRYETFVSQKDLYDRLKEEYGVIESIDVTYEDKIIFHTPRGKNKTVTAQANGRS
ncbi:MAG: FtsQ-type POTRA domain-containing protein [Acidobacteriota bacterium]|nr:FtsQ-type POTRA domain-containing protein [Acidobacteriota bacterium]